MSVLCACGENGASPKGGAGGATPGLAAAGCAHACRPRCWRFLVDVTRGGSPTYRPTFPLWSLHTPPAIQRRSLRRGGALHWGLDLARIWAYAGQAVTRRNRVRHGSLQSGRPVRPCLVVNPGEGRLRLGAIGRNRPAQTISPPLARLPRETNSLGLPVLHGVSAACAGCGPALAVAGVACLGTVVHDRYES